MGSHKKLVSWGAISQYPATAWQCPPSHSCCDQKLVVSIWMGDFDLPPYSTEFAATNFHLFTQLKGFFSIKRWCEWRTCSNRASNGLAASEYSMGTVMANAYKYRVVIWKSKLWFTWGRKINEFKGKKLIYYCQTDVTFRITLVCY